MVTRLIFKGQSITQLVIAVIGSVMGLFILMGSVQFYLDYTSAMFGGKDLLKDGFVVQKKVTALNTLNLGNSGFTEEDIKELKGKNFVEEIAPIKSTAFKVSATVAANNNLPAFYTDMFFQALPNKYVDTKKGEFNWQQGDSIIPIIIPISYLNLYNYGFAPSQGIPQLSEETFSIKLIDITFSSEDGYKEDYKGKIIGFSAKINTILVPESVIDYGNQKFGSPSESKTTNRLFVVANSKYHADFVELIEEKGLSVNQEKLKTSEQKSKLQIILSVLVFVAILIITLSILIFIQYAQIFINKSSYEIGVLVNIGYNYKYISQQYIRFFIFIFTGITVLTLIIALIAKNWFNHFMTEEKKIPIDGGLDSITYLIAGGFLVTYVALNAFAILRTIKNMARSN